MVVRNCLRCGKIFNYSVGRPICPICKKEVEEDFKRVKEFLRENPDSTIATVSNENNVSVQQIREWIREERLVFSKKAAVGIECERCGTSIVTGRYCDKCKKDMLSEIKGITAEREAEPVKMPKEISWQERKRFTERREK